MKQYVKDFILRGMVAAGYGPLVLAVFYLILQHQGITQTLTVNEVCLGIFSLTALAFVAGAMNGIYQIEHLPLMVAILIHGAVLYLSYLAVYLVNGWLKWGTTPILVFTVIFVVVYFVIWAIIYTVTMRKTEDLNEKLQKSRQQKAL